MRKKNNSIPVNKMSDHFGGDISIERNSVNDLRLTENILSGDPGQQSHRHDRHAFFLLERGTVDIEIDFKKYKMKAPSVIYLHPDQVHRTTVFKNVIVSSCAINNENLHPAYLPLLESIRPAKPLLLNKEIFTLISDTVSLFIRFTERKNDKLHHALLKDSCNTLVALMISLYLEKFKPADKLTRFERITKNFRELLEQHYIRLKRPAEYARKLNLSIPYLNESVKNVTGYSVSSHIQQRIVLEAKRLLYHSDKTVKEIAAELGFDDYPYFSRLFNKVTGMTALAFRNKNRD